MITELLDHLPQIGKLDWIGLRSAPRAEVQSVETTQAIAGLGLQGDHRSLRKSFDPNSKRQVTLIQFEHLAAIASLSGHQEVKPQWLRRNLLVSGINLLALKDRRFYIGQVLFEGTGLCQPCSRMEENLGEGGYNAMRGHGGITARIVTDGDISVGDTIRVVITTQKP